MVLYLTEVSLSQKLSPPQASPPPQEKNSRNFQTWSLQSTYITERPKCALLDEVL